MINNYLTLNNIKFSLDSNSQDNLIYNLTNVSFSSEFVLMNTQGTIINKIFLAILSRSLTSWPSSSLMCSYTLFIFGSKGCFQLLLQYSNLINKEIMITSPSEALPYLYLTHQWRLNENFRNIIGWPDTIQYQLECASNNKCYRCLHCQRGEKSKLKAMKNERYSLSEIMVINL